MTEKQAALTSLTEYRLRVYGYERQQRQSWEVARWTAWHIYANNPYIKPAQKPRTPMDVCRFLWDENVKKKTRITRKDCHISKGKEKALNAIYADFMARKQGIETTS